jgi:SAM-dependent methyltransferase
MKSPISATKNILRPAYHRVRGIKPVVADVDPRVSAANRYLSGSGIEIGAMHFPLPLPPHATAQYVDFQTTAQQRIRFPELAALDLVEPDIIDDGEKLSLIADESQDFVIACHVIEHCPSPLTAVANWLRVLRPGGIAFIAVPDKRFTFDNERPLTPLSHVIRDFQEGPQWSRDAHFDEWEQMWINKNDGRTPDEVRRLVARQKADAEDIHYHVWTQTEFLELILYVKAALGSTLDIELAQKNGIEFLVILRKLS